MKSLKVPENTLTNSAVASATPSAKPTAKEDHARTVACSRQWWTSTVVCTIPRCDGRSPR